MNRFFCVLAALIVTCGAGCQSAPDFSNVLEREWKLIDVRVNNKSINFDRSELSAQGFGDIFTLTFGSDRLSGVGAPNRYFAPYTPGENQSISVGNIAGTLMASFMEPEKLKEHEYFMYLQNANKWDLVKNNLELSSKGEDGRDVVLVFSEP